MTLCACSYADLVCKVGSTLHHSMQLSWTQFLILFQVSSTEAAAITLLLRSSGRPLALHAIGEAVLHTEQDYTEVLLHLCSGLIHSRLIIPCCV
jgi:hypothetical protein